MNNWPERRFKVTPGPLEPEGVAVIITIVTHVQTSLSEPVWLKDGDLLLIALVPLGEASSQ